MDDLLKAMMQFSKETGLLIGFSFEIMSPDSSTEKTELCLKSLVDLGKVIFNKENNTEPANPLVTEP
jgi:hypothetical protein